MPTAQGARVARIARPRAPSLAGRDGATTPRNTASPGSSDWWDHHFVNAPQVYVRARIWGHHADPQYSIYARAVASAIGGTLDRDGTGHPGEQTILRYAGGISRSKFYDALAELRDVLFRVRRRSTGPGRWHNEYSVLRHPVAEYSGNDVGAMVRTALTAPLRRRWDIPAALAETLDHARRTFRLERTALQRALLAEGADDAQIAAATARLERSSILATERRIIDRARDAERPRLKVASGQGAG